MDNRIILGLLVGTTAVFSYILNEHDKYIAFNTVILNETNRSIPSGQARAIESEMFYEYASKKFDKIRNGLDSKSNEVLDFTLRSMIYKRYFKFNDLSRFEIKFPDYHTEYMKQWIAEKDGLKNKYKLLDNYFSPEVFFFHHGLRFADKKILDYVKNKDIIDAGAYIGDSLLVLKDYTEKTIYCYEFSPDNIKEFRNTVKNNEVTNYKLIPVALGEKQDKMHVDLTNCISSGQTLRNNGDTIIDVTTIDNEAKKQNFNVGFIKMDVEGFAFPIIKGAIETIKKDRPVLSIAVYHNTEELFQIKPYLESNLENYVYEFKLQRFVEGALAELTLFCYPKEIMKENTKDMKSQTAKETSEQASEDRD